MHKSIGIRKGIMEKISKQSLLHVASLSLPSFQVIVISGNFGCGYCRQRVSQIISKITGLKEYTVDVENKQVIARGDVKLYTANHRYLRMKNKKKIKFKMKKKKHLLINFFKNCLDM